MEDLQEKLSAYREQLGCHCGCMGNRMVDDVVLKLMFAQGVYGKAFHYTSGYRCTKHNREVGGSIDSSHLYGEGVDIFYQTESDCCLIVKALLGAGFERIEIYSLQSAIENGMEGAHVHADQHHKKTMPWLHVAFYEPVKS